MNYLILGCNGFIGHALCQRLLAAGHNVTGCDIAPGREAQDMAYVSADDLLSNAGNIFTTLAPGVIVNCAGAASVPASFDDPWKDFVLNTELPARILDLMRQHNARTRFINLSSAAVYGNPLALPVSESQEAAPISPYGNHKHMSEIIVRSYRRFFALDAVSLRIFSAYGPGLKKQLFWDLYQKSQAAEQIALAGTGNESRDFIYIDDLVSVIELISTAPKLEYDTYNIANGEEITIRHCASVFCAAYSENHSCIFDGHSRLGDPINWRADISRIKALGYTPVVTMEQGIAEYVKWLKTL